tara:strand:- start:412 stop:636 length:225 start_codon:yes stop_codon:yes gene_type:complete
MRLQKKKQIKVYYDPSLKASSISAYVEPILTLFIDIIIIDIFEKLVNSNDLIDISMNINNTIAIITVLTDLSNK